MGIISIPILYRITYSLVFHYLVHHGHYIYPTLYLFTMLLSSPFIKQLLSLYLIHFIIYSSILNQTIKL